MADLLNINRTGKSKTMSNLPTITVLSTVVIAIATVDDGIISENIWWWRRFGEDRRFSDDYDCSAHGTLTLFLSIYHLCLTCQQLTRRLSTRRICLCVASILGKEIGPKKAMRWLSTTQTCHVRVNKIELEQTNYQDISMSILKSKVSLFI